MAHFAKLDSDNKVIEIHVVNNEVITDEDGVEQEQLGIDFLSNLHGVEGWKQTSFNGNFRKNYAGKGYTYDETRDAFLKPQPFPSWGINEDTCQWEPPTAEPADAGVDGKLYEWNEDTQVWEEPIKDN
tara:strand:+ start:303 stop:686 length:384 start_codon:yes stop_codon:yes gene_type:complete